MSPIVKNIIAVVVGIIVGGIVNMALIMVSGSIIPLPEGVDASNMESLKANMPSFEARHFIMPLLAHALGTLIGAFITAKLAANRKMTFALLIGAFFLIGATMNVLDLPAPLWFEATDLIIAYIPMAYLGGLFGKK
jgi:predicted ATP-dependent Lon-type protease